MLLIFKLHPIFNRSKMLISKIGVEPSDSNLIREVRRLILNISKNQNNSITYALY